MPSGPKIAKDPKPLYAKLPVSLHVALRELADRRLRKSGVEVDQKGLLEEAIRRLAEAEGVDLSQIEADVSKWSAQRKKPGSVHTFPRKRGPKIS